jgi:hypothetical protein
MPRFDGSYHIINMDLNHFTVTLDLLNKPHVFPTFHMSQVIPFIENDNSLFPTWQLLQPPPIIIDKEEEYFIDRILDECKHGQGTQYLIHWTGYGPEDDQWLPMLVVKDCKALDIWLA